MDEIRDAEIGALLSGGSVAEHKDGYWDALRTAVAPELEALEPQTLRRERTPRRRILRIGIAAAAVAAAAVVAFAILPALRGTDPATAADMLASMSRASSPIQTVRLRVVEGFGASSPASASPAPSSQASIAARVAELEHRTITDLVLSTNGDFRASQATEGPGDPDSYPGETIARPGQYGYDASRRELRIDSRTTGDGVQVLRPSWPTVVYYRDVQYLSYQQLANTVRAALAEADPNTSVSETTYLGRPAWTANVGYDEWPGVERRVTVDRATGLLLAIDIVEKQPGGVKSTPRLRVTRLEVDPDLPAGWEVVPLLKKARAFTRWNYFQDNGTRFGSPGSVAKLASPTPPLIPRWVPTGYRRAATAAGVFEDPRSRRAPLWKHVLTIPPQGSTPGTDVSKLVEPQRYEKQVVVQFRRGFDTFTVQVSPRLPGERLLDEGSADDPDGGRTVLTSGYMKGATAGTWISSTYIYRTWDGIALNEFTQGPSLLVFDHDWKVVISGGLTRQELVDVANSLEVYGK